MATMTVTIPDAVLPRVLDAFAGSYGYTATIPDPANPGQTIPNPVSKAAFAKQKLADFVKDTVRGFEAQRDAAAAAQAAITKANTDITLS